jgi:hypothetical protein
MVYAYGSVYLQAHSNVHLVIRLVLAFARSILPFHFVSRWARNDSFSYKTSRTPPRAVTCYLNFRPPQLLSKYYCA